MIELSPTLENAVESLMKLDPEDLRSVIETVYERVLRIDLNSRRYPVAMVKECPHCHAAHFVKNGRVRGRQRYKCLECDRTFGDDGKPVWSGSKKPITAWKVFIKATLGGDSLLDCAEKAGICTATAFSWRHKIYSALLLDASRGAVLGQKVQADETYVGLSFKGNEKSSNNLGRNLGKSAGLTTCEAYRGVGNARKRGNDGHVRGLNKENQVCAPMAVDEKGNCWGFATNMGAPSSKDLSKVYEGHLSEDAVLVTDKSKASRKYAEDRQIPILQLKGESEGRYGDDNLQQVNSLHSAVQHEIAVRKGVSTKYLSNYIQFVNFKRHHAGKSTSEMADILFEKMQNIEKITRWKDLKSMGYPDFVVERYRGAKEEPENPSAEDIPF
jgi:transposase-like protein